MKKITNLFFAVAMCFVLTGIKTFAANPTEYIPHKVPVIFNEDFSSKNPPKYFSITIKDEHVVKDVRTVEKGTQIYFEVVKVSDEKLAKLDASVVAKAVRVYIPSKNEYKDINNPNAVAKFSKYEPVDYTSKAVDAGISVANHFVSNVTYPAHFAKGVIQNKEGNRFKSGLKETYDSSVLSYASKGEPLVVKSGELATLTYYTKDAKQTVDKSEQ